VSLANECHILRIFIRMDARNESPRLAFRQFAQALKMLVPKTFCLKLELNPNGQMCLLVLNPSHHLQERRRPERCNETIPCRYNALLQLLRRLGEASVDCHRAQERRRMSRKPDKVRHDQFLDSAISPSSTTCFFCSPVSPSPRRSRSAAALFPNADLELRPEVQFSATFRVPRRCPAVPPGRASASAAISHGSR
jgi:hypothetical protein